ncbi:MAG: competence/damage-inducible protein A [Acidobacteriota bacterium]
MATARLRAAIVAVGSELLSTERLDTNSLRITELFERLGVELVTKSVIGDDEHQLADEIRRRLNDVEVLVLTGGLGPTADDVTRAAVARACDREISVDEAQVERIRGLFASFGRTMPEVNRRQAEVLSGARLIENRRGTAPGQHLEHAGSDLFLFPGVPRELRSMLEHDLEPWLRGRIAGLGLADLGVERRTLKVASLPESDVEERLAPVYATYGREQIAVLASPGEIRVVASAEGSPNERVEQLEAMDEAIHRAIGPAVYARGTDASLEEVVGRLLGARGATLAVAESCTGGLIGERVTRVAGSSAWFLGGGITYSNQLKMELLGVSGDELARHGAVSQPVAEAMAHGARQRFGSDLSLAVTGIAGPGGGSAEKPVGLVHVALAGPTTGEIEHRRVQFPGDRRRIRQMTSQFALDMLRRRLLRDADDALGAGA